MKRDAIMIKDGDNVATALRDIAAGETTTVGCGDGTVPVPLVQDIAYGHKFAVRAIAAGEDVLKYGEVIGRATADIPAGAHAHVHNVESLRGRGDLAAAAAD